MKKIIRSSEKDNPKFPIIRVLENSFSPQDEQKLKKELESSTKKLLSQYYNLDQKIIELEDLAKTRPLTQIENFIYKKTILKMKANVIGK